MRATFSVAISAQCLPHGLNNSRVIGLPEDGAAGHESVSAGVGHLANVARLDAAIDLQANVAARTFNAAARLFDLAQGAVDKTLPAKAGVHAHDEDEVNVVDQPVQHIQRRRRVERQPRLAAGGAYGLHAAMRVRAGFGVKADGGCACPGKGGGQRVHGLHHQVHVYGRGLPVRPHGVRAQGLANHGAEGEIGHVVVVHHVKVNPVGAGGQHAAHFFAQAGEVSRENGRGDEAGNRGNGGRKNTHAPDFGAATIVAMLEQNLTHGPIAA